ncbi:hypothetical protein [Paracoccus sp. DMF]|uniref:hypothetical protein n=1 Tax=Paracoccus sp. DMF TaxID=400837 RepID=UPI0011026060|nr:hypothetical protein [Paracoccus sp. DMF]MCV2448462.1 hypothetical protein [Paracoccus sp. DMF]
MAMLDEIRDKIGAVFSDTALFFSEATLTRANGAGGWKDDAGTTAIYPCRAMLESYSDHLRAVAGIPDTDVKVMIVGTSISVDPLKGDTVTLSGRRWAIIKVDTDPARAIWTCQARPV